MFEKAKINFEKYLEEMQNADFDNKIKSLKSDKKRLDSEKVNTDKNLKSLKILLKKLSEGSLDVEKRRKTRKQIRELIEKIEIKPVGPCIFTPEKVEKDISVMLKIEPELKGTDKLERIREDLYSFDETLEISRRIGAKQVIFTHIEEYWNRSYLDYIEMEKKLDNVQFAYDGMEIEI